MLINGPPILEQQVPQASFSLQNQPPFAAIMGSITNPVTVPPSFGALIGDRRAEAFWNIPNSSFDWSAWDSYIDEMQMQYDLDGGGVGNRSV